MLINPRYAIEQGWIKFPENMSEEFQNKCVQPNAIDFTLDKLFEVSNERIARITEDKSEKTMQRLIEVEEDRKGLVRMDQFKLYDGMSNFYVDVPEGVACDLIIRSSFNRVGLQLGNGLYDTGFRGNIGFTLFNRGGTVETRLGTRIAQIQFIESQSQGKYAGGYNTDNGQHWADK